MMATVFVQPLDLIKNRMQLSGAAGGKQYTSTFDCASAIIRTEGVAAVYSGLSAGLMRQATYTTARLGTYTWLMDNYSTFTKLVIHCNIMLIYIISIFMQCCSI